MTSNTTYYKCPWSTGCHMPTSTDPNNQQVLCRWHQYCLRSEHSGQMAGDFASFESWLAQMQHSYPSRGVWGYKPERLWPIVKGLKEAT